MNTYKFLMRLKDIADPPCLDCKFYEFCLETERCCVAFKQYVADGEWTTEIREPNYFTHVTKDGISESELSKRLKVSKSELESILSWCTVWELAFEEERLYLFKEIENAVRNGHPGMERAGRLQKALLCKILLEIPGSVDTERLNDLGKEIRRNA